LLCAPHVQAAPLMAELRAGSKLLTRDEARWIAANREAAGAFAQAVALH
jgi:hypothetical protein